MGIADRISNFRKSLNSYNDVKVLLSAGFNDKAIGEYIDNHLDKMTSDVSKYEILNYICHAFPERDDLYTKVLKSIDLHSKETKECRIGVIDQGDYQTLVYDQSFLPVSIIPLILNSTINAKNGNQNGENNDTFASTLSTILIQELSTQKIDVRTLPTPPYEEAYYMDNGIFTNTGKEDPEIIPSEKFLKFKEKYDTTFKIYSDYKTQSNMKA